MLKSTLRNCAIWDVQVPIAQLRRMGALELGLCCGCGGLKGCLASDHRPTPNAKYLFTSSLV